MKSFMMQVLPPCTGLGMFRFRQLRERPSNMTGMQQQAHIACLLRIISMRYPCPGS